MSFRKTLRVTFMGQAASLVLSVAFVLLSARWLGPTEKGAQSLLLSLGQTLALVLGIGLPGALPSIVAANPRMADGAFRLQVRLLLPTALLLGAGLAINARFGFYAPLRGYEAVVAALVLFTMLQAFLTTLALSVGEIVVSNAATAATALTSVGLLTAMHLLGEVTVSRVLWAQAAGMAVGAGVVLAWRSRWASGAAGAFSLGPFMRPASLGFLSNLFALLMFRGDVFLVASLAGVTAAGIYSVAVFAAEMALRLPQWAALVLSPSVAADGAAGVTRTIKLFWASTLLALAAYLVAVVGRVPLEVVLRQVAGPGYAPVYGVMLAIFPRVVMQAGVAILAGNLAGKGYTFYHPLASLAGMIGVWTCDVLFIPRFGIIGGGVASSVGYAAAAVIIFLGFLKWNDVTVREFSAVSSVLGRRATSVVR